MNGSYMLVAFMLGFWCVWSAGRDVNSLGEALGFTIIAIVTTALMQWQVPDFDNVSMVSWGILFLFVVIALEMVNRFSRTMALNMFVAVAAAAGWYFLALYLFSQAGIEKVSGFIG